jgi:hypothetical protein
MDSTFFRRQDSELESLVVILSQVTQIEVLGGETVLFGIEVSQKKSVILFKLVSKLLVPLEFKDSLQLSQPSN